MRLLILTFLALASSALPTAQAQTVQDGRQIDAAPRLGDVYGEDFDMKVVKLKYADADEAAGTIPDILRCHTGIDRRTNSVVVTGPPQYVQAAMDFLKQLDEPSGETEVREALIRVGKNVTPQFMQLLDTRITYRTRAALDDRNGLLALRGPASEIQAVHELIEMIEQESSRALFPGDAQEGVPRAVRATFFFLRCYTEPQTPIDPDAVDALPVVIKAAVPALMENGFTNPEMLVSMMIHVQAGEDYEVAGRTEADGEEISVSVRGTVDFHADAQRPAADLRVVAEMVKDDDDPVDRRTQALLDAEMIARSEVKTSRRTQTLFEIDSFVSAPIGDLVILAGSPIAEGEAVVLIVRLAPID